MAFAKEKEEDDGCGDAGDSVEPKQQRVADGSEHSAHGWPDGKAEVDRHSVEAVGPGEVLGFGESRHRRGVGGSEAFCNHREQQHERGDEFKTPQKAEADKTDSPEAEAGELHSKRPDSVGQKSTSQRAYGGTYAEHAQDGSGLPDAEVQRLAEIETHKREHHAAASVDEHHRGQHPGFFREAFEVGGIGLYECGGAKSHWPKFGQGGLWVRVIESKGRSSNDVFGQIRFA